MLAEELFVDYFIMKIFPTVICDINEIIYKTTKDHNILQNNLLWRGEFFVKQEIEKALKLINDPV